MPDNFNEIVVLSGKGGTGKTSISAAFATLGPQKTVADCDVDAANLHLILEPETLYEEAFTTGYKAVIHPEACSDCGVCLDHCRFDAITIKQGRHSIIETNCDGCRLCTLACPNEAIEMVASSNSRWKVGSFRNGSMVHARLAPGEDNSGKLVQMVRELASSEALQYAEPLVVIDGPPGIGCPAISSVTGAKKAVVVTEPSKSGLHDLKRILELLFSFRVETHVIINKFDLNVEMSEQIQTFCKFVGVPIVGRIPFDPEVVMAMVHCKSIVEWAPESAAAQEIQSIYQRLFQHD